MSYNYIRLGHSHNITEEKYHHRVLKLTAPKIKKLEKELFELHKWYIHNLAEDFIDYDIKHDILTSQINALKKL